MADEDSFDVPGLEMVMQRSRSNRRDQADQGASSSMGPPPPPPGLTNASAAELPVPSAVSIAAPEQEDAEMRMAAEVVDSASNGRLPLFIKNRAKEVLYPLAKKLREHVKTVDKRKKHAEAQTTFESGRVPNGQKPFRVPYENRNLDRVCYNQECVLEMRLPAGTTFRGALEKIFMMSHAWSEGVMVDLCRESNSVLEPAIKFETFREALRSKIPSLQEYSDLELPLTAELDLCPVMNIEQFAKSSYMALVRKIRDQRDKEAKQKEKTEAAKTKVREAANQLSPQEVLKGAIRQVIQDDKEAEKNKSAKPKNKGPANTAVGEWEIDYVNRQTNTDAGQYVRERSKSRQWTKSQLSQRKSDRSQAPRYSSQQPKNGRSPAAVQGQNSKGAGKGKSKNQSGGKTKSKGKGKSTNPGLNANVNNTASGGKNKQKGDQRSHKGSGKGKSGKKGKSRGAKSGKGKTNFKGWC